MKLLLGHLFDSLTSFPMSILTTCLVVAAITFVLAIIGTVAFLIFRPKYMVPVPGYGMMMGGTPVDPGQVAKILDVWREEWVATFGGTDHKAVIDSQRVLWQKEVINTGHANQAASVCDDGTHIRAQVYTPLCTCGLGHELVHQVFHAIDGNPEAGHTGKWTDKHNLFIVQVMQKVEKG